MYLALTSNDVLKPNTSLFLQLDEQNYPMFLAVYGFNFHNKSTPQQRVTDTLHEPCSVLIFSTTLVLDTFTCLVVTMYCNLSQRCVRPEIFICWITFPAAL